MDPEKEFAVGSETTTREDDIVDGRRIILVVGGQCSVDDWRDHCEGFQGDEIGRQELWSVVGHATGDKDEDLVAMDDAAQLVWRYLVWVAGELTPGPRLRSYR